MEYGYRIHREPRFDNWLDGLDNVAQARIAMRFENVEKGNLGDYKVLPGRNGLCELRFRSGAGIRVYFGVMGDGPNRRLVVVTGGGDKNTKREQQKEIDAAHEIWLRAKEKKSHELV